MALEKPDMNKPVFNHPDFMLETARVQIGWCPMCSNPVHEEDFRDQLSRKEYSISGMCQKCQDEIFSDPDDEYYEDEIDSREEDDPDYENYCSSGWDPEDVV